MSKQSDCIFCDIVEGCQTELILFKNEDIIIFKDIKPVSTHHYLAIPKAHKRNIKFLDFDDLSLVRELYQQGLKVLEMNGVDITDCRIGFHWHPFNSIDHLHLHLISPTALIKRFCCFDKYAPGSLWFRTIDWALEYLEQKDPKKRN